MLGTLLAALSPEKTEPDAARIGANTFESPYFKFHFSFPQSWCTLDDAFRMESNRKRHEEAAKRADVAWTYNLLMASPAPVSADEKLPLPFIHVLAIEGVPVPLGDYATTFARVKSFKLLQQQPRSFSGHEFIESDLMHNDAHYEAVFETKTRDYLLIFQFHGRTQEEMNTLAKSMESLKFDK
jgi:hypothetical protein